LATVSVVHRVAKGNTPETFTGDVLGVIDDGIAPDLDIVMVRLSSPEIDPGRRHLGPACPAPRCMTQTRPDRRGRVRPGGHHSGWVTPHVH
jgi:hypothetical protein